MLNSTSARRFARFGVFEVDLVSGELRKNGTKISLQDQPFQILAMLLERQGDVVTREELRRTLWTADTFVDFDHSLNTAIGKLRDKLGDPAVNPRFVETLAKRGYRFIAPVQWEPGLPVLPLPPVSPRPTPDPEPVIDPKVLVPIPPRWITRGLFLLAQLMYLIFYVEALVHFRDVHRIQYSVLPPLGAAAVVIAVLVTAGVGIALRLYLISEVAFDHQRFGDNFQHLFPVVLAMDGLWAVAPFLLLQKTDFGPAFAATAALVYLPFAERTLVHLAYSEAALAQTSP